MRKTVKRILLLVLTLAFAGGGLLLSGCDGGEGNGNGGGGKEITYYDYYRSFDMNEAGHLKVWGTNTELNLSYSDYLTAVAIQGLFNREEITYYSVAINANNVWLEDMKEAYGITTEAVTVDSMVLAYKEKFGEDAKYILYDKAENPESVNVATSLAGIFDAIPVDVTRERQFSSAKGYDMEMLLDASEMTEKECFSEYQDRFSSDALFQLDPNLWYPRDYWIAGKYFGIYQKETDISTLFFRDKVQGWTDDDSPIFGWGPTYEEQDVKIASKNNQFTVASDTSFNLTVLASEYWGTEFKQSAVHAPITAQKGKHYVCLMMSDGDNIQAVSNTFPMYSAYYKAQRAGFKMGWTVNVSCVDLQPSILNAIYRDMDKDDYFVASVSGAGYMFPSSYEKDALELFTDRLSGYLERADLHSLQILDNAIDEECFEYYGKIPNLYGCAVMSGNKYQDKKGSVYWRNGMPFVTCRFSLWQDKGANIAAQVNACAKDPNSIEGYSVINVHPWSCNYTDVQELVSNLDENVVVVTADDFFRLIRANVPQEDVDLTVAA